MSRGNAIEKNSSLLWILRASDSDSDISLRFGHWRQVNCLCSALITRIKTITDSLDIDCLTGLDTGDN